MKRVFKAFYANNHIFDKHRLSQLCPGVAINPEATNKLSFYKQFWGEAEGFVFGM